MDKALFSIIIVTLAIVGFFIYVGEVMTSISGQREQAGVTGEVSIEAGEEIFWGKGKCSTCHSLGTKGSAIRCPNQGVSDKFPLPVWDRAATRVKGKKAAEYIVESIYNPNVYVVEGYSKDVMKPINGPPISLSDDEILSVMAFLASQSTEVDEDMIREIAKVQIPYRGKVEKAGTDEASSKLSIPEGDTEMGSETYIELKCYQCHKIEGESFPISKEEEGGIGPDLTGIGSIQPPSYLAESILDPNAVIIQGEGYVGVDGQSLMPEYHDTMTLRQLLDLTAYLSSLK